MRLRIGQRQRRAPGAADHHPALEAEFFADHLHVRDQMRQRVGVAAALGAAAAGAALVEQHGVEAFGIEQPAVIGLAAAAGPAMQVDRGDAAERGRRSRHRSRGRRRRQAVPRSAAQTDRRVVTDFPASASGAMLAFRLQRAAGEIAIEEAVVVGGGLGVGGFEDLLVHRRQRAGRIGIAGVAGQRKGLAAAAAEIDFLEFAALARLGHPAGAAIAVEGFGILPDPGDRMI